MGVDQKEGVTVFTLPKEYPRQRFTYFYLQTSLHDDFWGSVRHDSGTDADGERLPQQVLWLGRGG